MVDAAKQGGVRRFVFSSVIDPILSALVNHSAKASVEEAIIESGMEYALLHPTLFFQGIAAGWPMTVKTGVFAEPWLTEIRFTRVDYRDVAEVAAIALTENRLLCRTYELCAEGNLNRNDVAALIGEVLGRKIEAARLNPDKLADASENSGDDTQMAAARAIFDWYDTHGLLGNPLTLRAILGREPRTLCAYIEGIAAESQPAE